MKSRTLVLVLLLLVVGSLFFVLSSDPEDVRLVSADGRFLFEAKTSQELVLTESLDGRATSRVSPVYDITPVVAFAVPAEVRFVSDLDPSTHVIGLREREGDDWIFLPITSDAGVFVASTTRTGEVALLQIQDVQVGDGYQALVNALVESRPKNAEVGQFYVSYALEEGDYVRIPSGTVTGGCGGNTTSASSLLQKMERVQPDRMRVGAAEREGWLKVTVDWLLGDGCNPDEPFQLIQS